MACLEAKPAVFFHALVALRFVCRSSGANSLKWPIGPEPQLLPLNLDKQATWSSTNPYPQISSTANPAPSPQRVHDGSCRDKRDFALLHPLANRREVCPTRGLLKMIGYTGLGFVNLG